MLIVDTHAHLFAADERRYPPRENPSRPPAGTGTIEHLRREMKTAGVDAVCAVQVSGFYRFDNRYICDVSKAHPDWIAGVVTLDPDDPDSPGKLAALKRDYGIRTARSSAARSGRMDDPGVRALWRAALDEGLVANVAAGDEQTADLERLLTDFPSLPVFLDHSLKLQAGPRVRETLAALKTLSRFPNLHTKLSMIANGPEGCADGFPCLSFHDAILEVIGMFGPDRCAWGAHFPLEKYSPRLSYRQAVQIYSGELGLSAGDQAAILGGTANRLWFGGRLRDAA